MEGDGSEKKQGARVYKPCRLIDNKDSSFYSKQGRTEASLHMCEM